MDEIQDFKDFRTGSVEAKGNDKGEQGKDRNAMGIVGAL